MSRGLILLYHRVTEALPDPWSLAVSPAHFAEHLEILRVNAHPLPLQALTRAAVSGDLPTGWVVLTFDDGYADTLQNARPALEANDVPATMFLPSGYLDGERAFWWDELTRILLRPGILPEELCLSIDGKRYKWDLGAAARYTAEAAGCHRRWKAWEPAPDRRQSLYLSVYGLLRSITELERADVLSELHGWAGNGTTIGGPRHCISADEAVSLSKQGLFEIGAHTVTHPVLSALHPAKQREEIEGSKLALEKLVNQSVTSFAYPYGGCSDYTAETVTIVSEAGFERACCTSADCVGPAVDLLQLPRLHVLDWNGDEFAEQLSRWLNQPQAASR